MLTSTMMAIFGMLITSGSCLKNTADSAVDSMTLSNRNFSTSTSSLESIEDLVDAKCKQYTAGLQDQVNALKAKVDRLEINKSDKDLKNDDYSIAKGMKKRDIPKKLQGICSTSSSLCTHYYPDHPDATQRKGKYSPTVPNEMSQNETSSKLIGRPTSCKDLQQLGHSLNGFYLIESLSGPNQKIQIKAVFCDFQSTTSVGGFQKEIGNVDIKTRFVHFSVTRRNTLNQIGIVPFEVELVNEGSAMNFGKGVFTAPVPGIYHFAFSGLKDDKVANSAVFLQVNGETFGISNANPQRTGSGDSLSLTASLRLKANDIVNLYLYRGAIYDDDSFYTHFTGWLVEEDLMKVAENFWTWNLQHNSSNSFTSFTDRLKN